MESQKVKKVAPAKEIMEMSSRMYEKVSMLPFRG